MGDGGRRPMPTWKVLLIAFGTVGVIGFGGCAALIVAANHTHFSLGNGPLFGDLGPKATPAELRAAATTMPPSHADCDVIRRVAPDGTTLADADLADSDGAHFAAYRDRLSRSLITFDIDLRRAAAVAHGPLRTHLLRAERDVYAGLVEIREAKTPADYDSATLAMRGADELEIGEQLLGTTCGGHLAPGLDKVFSTVPLGAGGPNAPTTTTIAGTPSS